MDSLVSGQPETTSACQKCASRHTARLEAANYLAELVDVMCNVDDDDDNNSNQWSDYLTCALSTSSHAR